ncbi:MULTISPECIES: LysE family translocator [unclassified Caulobacter]|uniref:LysE family translocator n=1 Tax=unclassified Caulobacter TaxID=2648921 RepID=UPI000D364656|nr:MULTISPECIES: LysE family translocator [unclassified Caulobacter]PTS87628.1 lysine transporter LysE [Caulobacter sp. HMWF009]PTT08371.1 lysine transporter LysE [Caulobacter sp. HMWF025]
MTPDLLLAFVLFAFATAGTPGPNNMMLLASGANFGFRRTILHILGISVGLAVMVVAMGLGLSGLFRAVPVLHDILKWAGAAYMLWLAWKIATATGVSDRSAGSRPMSFLQAAGFQWLNPKAWAMALGAVTTYTPEGSGALAVLVVAGTFMLVGAPCSAAWAGFGQGLRPFLDRPAALRAFNLTMAVLLVASLYPLLHTLKPA